MPVVVLTDVLLLLLRITSMLFDSLETSEAPPTEPTEGLSSVQVQPPLPPLLAVDPPEPVNQLNALERRPPPRVLEVVELLPSVVVAPKLLPAVSLSSTALLF